jgi:hypothetical protein
MSKSAYKRMTFSGISILVVWTLIDVALIDCSWHRSTRPPRTSGAPSIR